MPRRRSARTVRRPPGPVGQGGLNRSHLSDQFSHSLTIPLAIGIAAASEGLGPWGDGGDAQLGKEDRDAVIDPVDGRPVGAEVRPPAAR